MAPRRSLGWRVARGVLLGLGAGYLMLALALTGLSRRLIFPVPPARPLHLPPGMERIDACGAEGVLCLYVRAPPDGPTLVFFHGNGEQLADFVPDLARWSAQGVGVLAVEYPGYPGAPGSPSEVSLLAAARAALAHLRGPLGVPPARTVLFGRSLGTGVATALAREGAGERLVLVSPFTSLPAVGQRVFPFLPVRWLVRDRFDSLTKAPSVKIPVLVLHGTQDEVVPFDLGRTLAGRFPHATFVPVPGAGHNDILDRPSVIDALLEFVRSGRTPPSPLPR